MKILFFIAFCSIFNLIKGQSNDSEKKLDSILNAKRILKTIDSAQIGDLICIDEFGKYIKCTGDQFEVIKGFTTSAPYVTPNKPLNINGSKLEFTGRFSNENGNVIPGDKLCPSKQTPGTVCKCLENEIPYAAAMENATENGVEFKVKVYGNRIK